MSLFSALNIGRSSLQASQNALNTTTHNMSNINTPGYTRQQVSLSDKSYINKIGSGVNYSKTRQVRDEFMDKSYREQSAKSGYYSMKNQMVENMETLLSSDSGSTFYSSLNNLWNSIQEISKNPDDSVNKSAFIQKSNDFVVVSKSISNELFTLKNDLKDYLAIGLDKINSSIKSLASLNKQITKLEANGEDANDLRDKANLLLDDLSKYTNIDVKNTKSGYQLYINNQNVVDGKNYFLIKDTDFIKNNGGEIGAVCELLDDSSEFSLTNVKKQFDEMVLDITGKINNVFEENNIDEKVFVFTENEAVSNLSINFYYQNTPTNLSFLNNDGSIKFKCLNDLSSLDLTSNYKKMIEDLSINGSLINNLSDTQEKSLNMIKHSRNQLLCVSSDEELANLIAYQNMYNASGRYINTVNDMMDTLMNM